MKEKQKGITLIALVITIIVLLILAGVSIAMLTGQNGVLSQANNAKIENRGAAVEEAKDIWKVSQEVDKYSEEKKAQDLEGVLNELLKQNLISDKEKKNIQDTGKVKIGSREIIFWEKGILDELKVGDYIKYIPDYNTYKPKYNEKEISTEDLYWIYMGTDENKNILLVSEGKTEGTIYLNGADGYNDGVNVIDDTCENLYDSDIAKNVRNLKIEDIERVMTKEAIKEAHNFIDEDVKYEETKKYTGEYAQYPYLYEKEKGGKINGIETSQELGLSDKGNTEKLGISKDNEELEVTQTYWSIEYMNNSDFINLDGEKYADLFFPQNELFWLSSRYVRTTYSIGTLRTSKACEFGIRSVFNDVEGIEMTNSLGKRFSGASHSFRPVIVIDSNINKTGGSGSRMDPYIIANE